MFFLFLIAALYFFGQLNVVTALGIFALFVASIDW